MVATQFTRTERRTLRWMSRRGSGLQPSEPAFQLLGARLSVRWWVGCATYGLLATFLVLWIGWWSPSPATTEPVVTAVLVSLVPVAVFAVLQIVFVETCRRWDRRLASALPHRVSRTAAVPVRTVLGPLATGLVALAVAGHVVIVVVLFRGDERLRATDAVAYAVGAAVVALIVALTLRQVVHRPTVAVDVTALAVDERLRATDALLALWPLFWSGFGLLGSLDLGGTAGFDVVLWVSTALVVGSSLVWFSHPDARARYGRGGVWGPV